MAAKAVLVNLAIFVSLTALISRLYSIFFFKIVTYTPLILGVCALSSMLYPVCLRALRSEIGYLKEVLILLLVFPTALGIPGIVYYRRMEPLHHDFSESIVILALYLMALESIAVASYSITFFALRRSFKKMWLSASCGSSL